MKLCCVQVRKSAAVACNDVDCSTGVPAGATPFTAVLPVLNNAEVEVYNILWICCYANNQQTLSSFFLNFCMRELVTCI